MVQTDRVNNKILIVCGPTASGKTALAVSLAKALASEVVSADSMYIYKGFDIGTAKPSEKEMEGVKHHMIDVVESGGEFSVSDYKALARPKVDEILSKGKIPVVCGGTGFYINALLYDYSYGNAAKNEAVRAKYEKILAEYGNDRLYALLAAADPETAEKLHRNDVRRVIRALEIYETSGKAKSQYNDGKTPRYDYVAVCYDRPREELYRRINERVDLMFLNGLKDEVQKLCGLVGRNCQAMQGIGYKETLSLLDGTATLEETKELIKQNSRRYAKRQITFFKRLAGLQYLQAENIRADTQKVLSLL